MTRKVDGKRRGNWQFQIDGVDPEAEDITFSKGGFQEGHGGGIGAQPFFIEGVREALDAKGEWWVDVSRTITAVSGLHSPQDGSLVASFQESSQ